MSNSSFVTQDLMVEYVNKKVQSMLNDTLQQRQDVSVSMSGDSDEMKELKTKLQ